MRRALLVTILAVTVGLFGALTAEAQTGVPLFDRYDTDGSGELDLAEVVAAIDDYVFDGTLTLDEIVQILDWYLFGPPEPQPSSRPGASGENTNRPAALREHGVPPPGALPANPQPGDTPATITVQLVNASNAGIGGERIAVTTTRGVLTSSDVTAPNTCQRARDCTLTTQADGTIAVELAGNGTPGDAEVTFRHAPSGLSHTSVVTLHGPAASLAAAVDQGAIAVGDSTFIIVTISDASGNPVVGAQADVRSNQSQVPAVVGPQGPAGSTVTLVEYDINIDRNLPGVANDVPACGDQPTGHHAPGTNTAGKCAIKVTAPAGGPGRTDDATAGTHTITIGTANPQIPTVSVQVQVVGAPAIISTDAPTWVDSLSSTVITVTVLTDEGVRVGAVPLSVFHIKGGGQITNAAPGMTSDGRATFTYLAPLEPDEPPS